MELTPEQIELKERTARVRELMLPRGYKETAMGTNGETLFYLKKIDDVITVHAAVKVRRLNVELDIIGTLGMNVILTTNPILVDTTTFEKTEQELIRYGKICLGGESGNATTVGSSNETGMAKVSEEKQQKTEKTLDDRKKEFWNKIREVGKQKAYEKDMCLEFYEYWTQKNEQGKKMRFEKETTWDLAGRLRTWLRNDANWKRRYETIQERAAQKQDTELANTGTKHIKHSDLF